LRFPTVLVAALLGGCAADTGDTRLQIVFDVCQPVVLVPGPGAGDDEVASLDSAIAMWNRLGQSSLSRGEPGERGELGAVGDVLEVEFETAAAVFHGVYDDERGRIFINLRLEDDHARAVTIAHELGHAFGLLHVSGRTSVMNARNLVVEPNADDVAELRGLWGDCAGQVADSP
jgi:hypothetical protein